MNEEKTTWLRQRMIEDPENWASQCFAVGCNRLRQVKRHDSVFANTATLARSPVMAQETRPLQSQVRPVAWSR